MKILIINCGSSSIKYQLYAMPEEKVLAKGMLEKIGEKGSKIANHTEGLKQILHDLVTGKKAPLESLSEIGAVGHRVVHGGELVKNAGLIDKKMLKIIEDCCKLAPLHNPANLAGILAVKAILPKVPQVAVFDTAFHQTIPAKAYLYALPHEYYRKYKIRRYGFHGTSHQYVAQTAAEMLDKPLKKLKLISCHLGNGCSVTAIKYGKSIDTSMGFTPLEGLVMGTRSGDIDPAIICFLIKEKNFTAKDLDQLLNKQSGLLGISGVSNDVRTLLGEAEKGHKRAKLALAMFAYRVKKYIGAYIAALGGIDAIIFTGGVGANSAIMRDMICEGLYNFLDPKKVPVLIIPTDEEVMIARQTHELTDKKRKKKTK
jgi:acetate kinase